MQAPDDGCSLLSNAPLPLHYRRNVLLKFVGATILLLGAMWLFSGCAFLSGEYLTAESTRNTHLMMGPLLNLPPAPSPYLSDAQSACILAKGKAACGF